MAADPNLTIIRPSWPGYSGLRFLMIFGDSYSDVGYDYTNVSSIPTDETPLGIEFPGVTWAEPAMPNWVGYLITEYSPATRLLVYDYAVGGDTVGGVRKQVQVHFLPRVGEKPSWARWSMEDSLFVTWIGINDCGQVEATTVPSVVEELFVEQECLYNAGARNFLFIDVPPIHRTPVAAIFSNAAHDGDVSEVYRVWNTTLREHILKFAADHQDATILLFSSWATFTRVLDDPKAHGFVPEHVARPGGGMWVDHLHPSTKMHDWMAHDLANYLHALPAYELTGDNTEET